MTETASGVIHRVTPEYLAGASADTTPDLAHARLVRAGSRDAPASADLATAGRR